MTIPAGLRHPEVGEPEVPIWEDCPDQDQECIQIDRKKLPELLANKVLPREDGNHRLALAENVKEDPSLLTKCLAPLCILLLGPPGETADDYSESLIFHTINSTAWPLESEHAMH